MFSPHRATLIAKSGPAFEFRHGPRLRIWVDCGMADLERWIEVIRHRLSHFKALAAHPNCRHSVRQSVSLKQDGHARLPLRAGESPPLGPCRHCQRRRQTSAFGRRQPAGFCRSAERTSLAVRSVISWRLRSGSRYLSRPASRRYAASSKPLGSVLVAGASCAKESNFTDPTLPVRSSLPQPTCRPLTAMKAAQSTTR